MSSRIYFQVLQITDPGPFSLAISATTSWPVLLLLLRDWHGTYRFLGLELVIESIPRAPKPFGVRIFELMQSVVDEVLAGRETERRAVGLLTPRRRYLSELSLPSSPLLDG